MATQYFKWKPPNKMKYWALEIAKYNDVLFNNSLKVN